MLKDASDPISKDNIKTRLNFAVYKNNPDLLQRNDLFQKILPYSALTDAEIISNREQINPLDYELRINFLWYIDTFEAEYTDIVLFIDGYFKEDTPMSDRLNSIKTILYRMAEKRAIKKIEEKPASKED